ncbi:g9652 [Coccomyxa elongata]
MPIVGLDLTDAQIFQGVNLVLPAWLLLILLPRWKFSHSFATFTAVGFSILYTLLFGTLLAQPVGDFSFDKFFTYEGVKDALSSPEVVLPAWVHYVAFDLFTAKWMVQDSIPRSIPHLLLVPCLLLTMMLGPMGLLSYFIVRTITGAVRRKDGTKRN